MNVIKKLFKILMIVFMVVGICISISNLLSVELDSTGVPTETYDYGLDDCGGPTGSC